MDTVPSEWDPSTSDWWDRSKDSELILVLASLGVSVEEASELVVFTWSQFCDRCKDSIKWHDLPLRIIRKMIK